MDAFKHKARNKELANSLMGSVPDKKRIHRTFGGFVSGAGSIGLPMIGEMMGGPLGGVAGNILGMAAEHIGSQMDGHGGGSSRGTDNYDQGFRPRNGTFNPDATRRGSQINDLARQTGVQPHEYNGSATNTFDDDYATHQQNEIDRLQTIGQNNEMRQELESLSNQLRMRP